MVVRPNKPVMFAVDHIPFDVSLALNQFREALVGKKKLFIELSPSQVQAAEEGTKGIIRTPEQSYQQLVVEAMKAGIEIVPLDVEKTKRAKEISELFHREANYPIRNRHRGIESKGHYENKAKREKKWDRLLEGEGSTALIVMHPSHAKEIIELRKIPKENIAYLRDTNYDDPIERVRARSLSTREAKRIEAERLKRYRAKAMKRLARQPKSRNEIENARIERARRKAEQRLARARQATRKRL